MRRLGFLTGDLVQPTVSYRGAVQWVPTYDATDANLQNGLWDPRRPALVLGTTERGHELLIALLDGRVVGLVPWAAEALVRADAREDLG